MSRLIFFLRLIFVFPLSQIHKHTIPYLKSKSSFKKTFFLDNDNYIKTKPFCARCQKIIYLFICNITSIYIYLFILLTLQEAKKVAFMAFVGVCIIFQAIISDVYVYNKKAVTLSPTTSAPSVTPANINHSTTTTKP